MLVLYIRGKNEHPNSLFLLFEVIRHIYTLESSVMLKFDKNCGFMKLVIKKKVKVTEFNEMYS